MYNINGATVEMLEPAPYAHVGDLIQTTRGDLFKVTAIKRVNYQVMDADGKFWNLRKSGAFKAQEGAVFADPTASDPDPVADVASFCIGTVVEFRFNDSRPGKFVVIRNNGETMAVAKLGGEGGRYYRSVSPLSVKIVEP